MSQNVINTLNFRQNLHQTSIYWVFTKSIKVGHRIEVVNIPETIKIYFYTPAYKVKAAKLEFRLNKLLSTLRPSTYPKRSHICSDRSIVHMCLRVPMFAQLPRVIYYTLRFWMCMFACVDSHQRLHYCRRTRMNSPNCVFRVFCADCPSFVCSLLLRLRDLSTPVSMCLCVDRVLVPWMLGKASVSIFGHLEPCISVSCCVLGARWVPPNESLDMWRFPPQGSICVCEELFAARSGFEFLVQSFSRESAGPKHWRCKKVRFEVEIIMCLDPKRVEELSN